MIDAWFHVTTARHGDLVQGVILAGIIEVPSALVLLWVAHRGLRHTVLLPARGPGESSRSNTFDTIEPFD
jgi:hypothetical protein